MSKRRKNFNINVKPRDVLVDIKGLSEGAVAAFLKFWMHHHLHGEPLPPAEERVDDVDEYFRDLLDMKNVRTWRKARDELVAKARIRMTTEGRYYIGRTMREVGGVEPDDDEDDGGADQGGGGQGSLSLTVVRNSVDELVDDMGQAAGSPDGCPNIATSSGEVPPNIERSSSDVGGQVIDFQENRGRPFMFSSTPSPSSHAVVAVTESRCRAGARDGPGAIRAGP